MRARPPDLALIQSSKYCVLEVAPIVPLFGYLPHLYLRMYAIAVPTQISLQTMTVLLSIPAHASVPDLLNAVARSAEFGAIKLRRGEKKVGIAGQWPDRGEGGGEFGWKARM